MSFTIFWNEKNAFLGYKNNKFKKSKNWHFPKRLVHGFGPKMAFFPTYCIGNIDQENVFYFILEQKTHYYAIKTSNSKNRKIDFCPKGLVHGFGAKLAIFPSFFFQAI